MKHEKLKQICQKSKRYRIMGLCCIIPFAVMLVIFALISHEQANDVFIGSCLGVGLIAIVGSIIFSRIEGKWDRIATDYIVIKIMDAVNEFGIDSNNFEIIQECCGGYRVGFHNQMVDYEKLQVKLDEEVAAMNKITGYVTRVKLI